LVSAPQSQTRNFYDVRGNLVETRSLSKTTTGADTWVVTRNAYDSNGRLEYTFDPVEASNPDVTSLTNPGTKTEYDALGRVTVTRRYQSVTIKLENHPTYSGLKRPPLNDPTPVVVSATPLSSFNTYYDDLGQVLFTRDSGTGLISQFRYDEAGRQVESIQYLSGELNTGNTAVINVLDPTRDVLNTTFQYDNVGRQTVVTDDLGRSTRTVYDELGRAVETVFHDGTVAKTRYNERGQRVAEVAQYDPTRPPMDFASITTNYEYDDAGRLTAVVLPPVQDPTGPLVRPRYEYEYDQYGNQAVVRDPNAQVTTFAYDHLNRQVARTLPLGQALTGATRNFRETREYDSAGRLARSTDFERRTVDYLYDQLGRLDVKRYFGTTTPGADGPGVSTNYAEAVDYVYDALGRQTKVVQDFDGNFLSTPDQRVTDQVFDEFGRMMQVSSPEGVLNYRYNLANGFLERTFSSATTASGAAGDAVHSTQYGYDRLGRQTTVTVNERNNVPVTEVTEYRYDRVGNLDMVLLPAAGSSRVITDYNYDPLYRLVSQVTFVNGNPGVNVTLDSGEQVLGQYDYTLRADGKRSKAVEKVWNGTAFVDQTYTWQYDNAGRLTQELYDLGNNGPTAGDYKADYSFSLTGNRLQKKLDDQNNGTTDVVTTYLYDTNDRLLVETEQGGTTKRTLYDYGIVATSANASGVVTASGSATQQTGKREFSGAVTTGAPVAETRNTFDRQGHLQQVQVDPDGGATFTPTTTVEYRYSDSGIRAHKVEGTNKTIYLVDGQNPTGYAQVFEEITRHATTTAFVSALAYTLGLDVISQATFNPATASAGPSVYLLYDGHGSTRALATSAGAVSQVYAYDAYGNHLTTSGFTPATSASTSLLYSGEQTDKATALQYLRARYYDPRTGRFNRLDDYAGNSADPQSLHKYLYAHGDSVNRIDPSGLAAEYNLVTGIESHLVFYYLFPRDPTARVFTDTRIDAIVRGIGGDIDSLVTAARRPDATVTNGPLRGFYELKPITHRTSPHLAAATQLQLAGYDLGFSRAGIGRGQSSLYVGAPADSPVEGGFVLGPRGWHKLTFYAANAINSFGGDTRGLVYYSLSKNPVRQLPYPQLAPATVPERYRSSIAIAPMTVGSIALQPVYNAAIQGGTIIAGAATIGLGVHVAAFTIASLRVPI
jgi:RHS repeat-associated protein